MFKLVKILNSRNNCPEFIKLTTETADVPLVDRSIVGRDFGSVCLSEPTPLYVLVGDYDINVDPEVIVYPITEDMIFKTEIIGDMTDCTVGSRVKLASKNGNLVMDSVECDPDGVGRIISFTKDKEGRIFAEICFNKR